MTPRKMFLSTALSGVLFMSLTSFSQPGYAAIDTHALLPTGDWSFSEETQGDKTVGPYCMMAQKYKQDLFLVFAENLRGERSVAFDFQKNKFDPSRTYSVLMNSGPDEQRSYEVKPISDHVFVVRFGKDNDFFDAMNRSGELSVEFAGNRYDFTLKNTKQGWQQVGACIASLKVPLEQPTLVASMPSTENMLDPVETVAVSDEQDLAHDVSTIVKRPSLKPKALPLSLTPEITPEIKNEATKTVSKLSARADDMVKQLSKLRAENESLKKELTNMAKIQLSIAESRKSEDAPVTGVDNSDLISKNETLQAELNAALEKVKNLEKKITTENSGDKTKQDKITQSEMAYLKKENARLIKELKAYDTDVSSDVLRDERDTLVKKVHAFEGDLKIAQRENERLTTEMERMRLAIENGQLAALPGDWDTVQATKRYHESQREIRRLGAALEQEKVMCEQEKKDIEQMLFDPELASGAQIYLINSMETKLKESEQKVSSLENDLAQAKVDIMFFKNNQQKGNPEAIASLKQELAVVQESEKEYQNKYLEAQAQIKTLKENNALSNNNEMIALTDEVTRLKTAADRHEAEIAEKIAMIDALESKSGRLQKQVADLTIKTDDSAKDLKVTLLQEENKRLQSALDERLAALPDRERKIKELEKQVEALKNLVTEQEARLEQKDASLESMQEKTVSLQSEVTKQLSGSSENESKIRMLEQKNILLQAELDKFFEKVPAQETKLTLLEQKNKKLIEALEKQLKVSPAKDMKIKTLKQELADLRSELDQRMASFTGKEERIKLLEQSLITAQARLQENSGTQKEMASTKAQLAALEKKYEGLRKEAASSYKQQMSNAAAYNNIMPAAGEGQSVQESAESVALHTTEAHFMNEKDITALLKKAAISLEAPVVKTTKTDDVRSFRWQTGPLYGSVEMKELGNIQDFDSAVSRYLEKTKGRCKGEFAAMPGNEFSSFGGKVKTYEIACVSGNVRSSAALLFHSRGPVFTVIAHEGAAAYMQEAMNLRDKLIEALKR